MSKYEDHSDKYGIPYLLTNRDVGILFNDKTYMIMQHNN